MYHSLNKRVLFTITPFKESCTLFQIWILFAMPSLIFPHLELSRIPKLMPSILEEIFIISFFLVDQFHFYMQHPIRVVSLKSLSLNWRHHHIVLKSLAACNTFSEDDGVVSKIYYFMVSFLYRFCSLLSSIEILIFSLIVRKSSKIFKTRFSVFPPVTCWRVVVFCIFH